MWQLREMAVARPQAGRATESPTDQTTTTPMEGRVLATRPPYGSGPTDPQEISVEATEVRPVGRYEWESIVRRARLGAVVEAKKNAAGKTTKGGMSGTLFTGIALCWSSYAGPDGDCIWPGDATVAVDLETSIPAVRTVRQALVKLGLMRRVRGRRGDHGEEYRLTLPSDLLDRLEVLTPAQHKLAAERLRERARGLGWSSGQPERADHRVASEGPVDNPSEPNPPTPGWSTGPSENSLGWSSGTHSGGPVDPLTDQDLAISTTDHSGEDLHTAVTVSRVSPAAEDRISSDVVGASRPPAGRPPDNRPRHRPRPRPVWWAEIEERVVPPPESPGRAAFAAARATLTARQATTHADLSERARGDAWDRLVALTT